MKSRILKILAFLVIGLVMLVGFGLTYVKTALPNVGDPPTLTVKGTSEQIARGEYLANHVMVCMDCHSKRDWEQFAGPPIDNTLGMGGEVFDQKFGF
ncbi:MAG: cytochrome C, partial [Saprospiraceae bacterium]